jgi:hypothetical protein
MKLSWLATVTDGLMESEQLFPEPPLFLSMRMGTGVVLKRLVHSAFNHLKQLLAQGSFTKKKIPIFMKSKAAYKVWQKSNATDFLLTTNFILFYKSRLSPSK